MHSVDLQRRTLEPFPRVTWAGLLFSQQRQPMGSIRHSWIWVDVGGSGPGHFLGSRNRREVVASFRRIPWFIPKKAPELLRSEPASFASGAGPGILRNFALASCEQVRPAEENGGAPQRLWFAVRPTRNGPFLGSPWFWVKLYMFRPASWPRLTFKKPEWRPYLLPNNLVLRIMLASSWEQHLWIILICVAEWACGLLGILQQLQTDYFSFNLQ